MLKIKDNVDLKELEKFGFHVKYTIFKKIKNLYNEVDAHIYIDAHRNIGVETSGDCEDLDTLYELIKADLVEKVESEE
jgi:hypothetical protein